MPLSRILLVAAVAAFGWFGAPRAHAVDDPVEFLHALQEGGYPDIAVEYLRTLKDQSDAPKEILDLWDLEMSRSLRAAAKFAYNDEEAKRLTDEAQGYLQKFIKEKPNHPEAIKADAAWADMLGLEALRELRKAKEAKDPKEQAEGMEKVRKLFGEVRPKLVGALEKFRERLGKTPKPAKAGTIVEKRQYDAWLDAQAQVVETEIKIGVTDFLLAQTYTEEKNKAEREAALKKAGKDFDKIFQAHRGTIWGLQAHFLHARTMHELGQLRDAIDIYDEVLVAQPEISADQPAGKPKLTGYEGMYAEAQQYRLQILLQDTTKKTAQRDYINEAKQWQKPQYEVFYLKTDGYQGILWDYVKFIKPLHEKAEAADKAKYVKEMLGVLRKMRKVPSQYQPLAAKLYRDLTGGDESDAGVEELIAEAGEQASAKPPKWAEARKLYAKALEAAQKGKKPEPKAIADLRDAIAGCDANLALQHFHKNELAQAEKLLRVVVKDYRDTKSAQEAAKWLLTAVTNEYAKTLDLQAGEDGPTKEEIAEQQAAARKKLIDTANEIKDAWPGKDIADTARLALLRIAIYAAGEAKTVEQFNEGTANAVALFREINPKAPDYPTALYLVGHTYWRRYSLEKKRVEAAGGTADAEQKKNLDDWRNKAVKGLERAVVVAKDLPKATDGSSPKQLIDAQLLLAEMLLEGDEGNGAAALFQPLVDEAQKKGAKSLDPTTLRIFNGAVNAYLLTNELEKAGLVIEVLLKLGPDDKWINISLVTFARRLDKERAALEEALKDLAGPSERDKLKEKLASYEKMLRDVLVNLAGRNNVSLAGMIWMLKTYSAMGMNDEAVKLGDKIKEQLGEDAESKKILAGIRLILLSVLRKQQKYEKAIEEVDQFLEDQPKYLPARMEKGYILQAWAATQPEKYEEAIAHWNPLRIGLERAKDKRGNRMPEFYDVIYNQSLCTYQVAKKDGDKDRALKGEQIIRQLLMMDDKLTPENETRLRKVADQLCELQGKTPPKPPAKTKKSDASKKPAVKP